MLGNAKIIVSFNFDINTWFVNNVANGVKFCWWCREYQLLLRLPIQPTQAEQLFCTLHSCSACVGWIGWIGGTTARILLCQKINVKAIVSAFHKEVDIVDWLSVSIDVKIEEV